MYQAFQMEEYPMDEEQPKGSEEKHQHRNIEIIEHKNQEVVHHYQSLTRYGLKVKTVNRLIKSMMSYVHHYTKMKFKGRYYT